MLDKRICLPALEVSNEPLGLVAAMGWAAEPDAVPANDDEVRTGRGHFWMLVEEKLHGLASVRSLGLER